MLLHITTAAAWFGRPDHAAYIAPSLHSEGFIHCSTRDQVVGVANALFAGLDDLVLLTIDPERLTAPVVYEDCYATGQSFPHLYGPLPAAAVTAVVPFPHGPDGTFTLPASLEAPPAA